jgi:hypothetical protein
MPSSHVRLFIHLSREVKKDTAIILFGYKTKKSADFSNCPAHLSCLPAFPDWPSRHNLKTLNSVEKPQAYA